MGPVFAEAGAWVRLAGLSALRAARFSVPPWPSRVHASAKKATTGVAPIAIVARTTSAPAAVAGPSSAVPMTPAVGEKSAPSTSAVSPVVATTGIVARVSRAVTRGIHVRSNASQARSVSSTPTVRTEGSANPRGASPDAARTPTARRTPSAPTRRATRLDASPGATPMRSVALGKSATRARVTATATRTRTATWIRSACR
jgi:hypothetical protein